MPMQELNPIEQLFYSTPHYVCQKWAHYFQIYERHFSRFRGKSLTFLEIGVSQGGSIDLWRRYFGSQVSIIGVDIDPGCMRFNSAGVKIIIGDQGDPAFLSSLAQQVGQVDVILDDGGHRMDQQILTFDHLYPVLKEDGVYMCEDVHTSYDAAHGGGRGRTDTFLTYMKERVDDLYDWYGSHPGPSSLARNTLCLSFYDSIVVLEKQRMSPPTYVEVGFSRADSLA